jgi:hypothetical protein
MSPSQARKMKLHLVKKISLALLALIGGCKTGTDSHHVVDGVKHVVVIGVDGMSPDGVMKANTPVMDELMKNGAYTLTARGVLPTSSSSNWASMVSGAGPEKHGVTSNGWERDDFNFPAVSTGTEEIFPTIFGVARKQRPDMEIGAIYNWSGFGRLIERSALSYELTKSSVVETVKASVVYIRDKKPGFLFVHLDHVDHAGHHDGHKTKLYYDAVAQADTYIGEIIQATKDAGIFEETVFIVSADHGGIGYSHGGETLDELEIPFIISGKGVKKGYIIPHEVFTYDNAATVAFLMGIKQPYSWTGRAITSAFDGFEDPEPTGDKISIPPPIIYPVANLYDPAGGFFKNEQPEVKMESGIPDAIVRYTLDGLEPDENSTAYTAPFTLAATSVVSAKSFAPGNRESRTSLAYFRIITDNPDNGIQYDYYENSSWKFLPIFAKQTKLSSGITHELRIGDIPKRKDHFAIRYKTYLKIDSAGTYKFYALSDDGSKLFIDGESVVDNDGGHGPLERTGTIELSRGKHELVVEYFNAGGGGWLEMYYRGPGIPKQIVPAGQLFLKK